MTLFKLLGACLSSTWKHSLCFLKDAEAPSLGVGDALSQDAGLLTPSPPHSWIRLPLTFPPTSQSSSTPQSCMNHLPLVCLAKAPYPSEMSTPSDLRGRSSSGHAPVLLMSLGPHILHQCRVYLSPNPSLPSEEHMSLRYLIFPSWQKTIVHWGHHSLPITMQRQSERTRKPVTISEFKFTLLTYIYPHFPP